MIIEDSMEQCYLQSIEYGEIFRYDGNLYMRIHAFRDCKGKDRTVVDIRTGSPEYIDLNVVVGRVKAKVVVE